MAKIETTFIRPKELYTPETGETKVVYDGYQNNPHELVVEENLEGEVSEIVNDTFVPNEGGNVVFTDNNETEHELITEDGFAGALDAALPTALAKAQVIKTTWQELKDKRDSSQLVAGSLYRITDYNCTTTQENTQSAGHQFDIVLLALSADKLAEEGWAMEHPTDIYDVTFTDSNTTSKCYLFPYDDDGDPSYNIVRVSDLIGYAVSATDLDVNENNKTAILEDSESAVMTEENLTYNYFQNSKLEAWKVWYCLDNDTARFAWADDRLILHHIMNEGSPVDYIRTPESDSTIDGVEYYAWVWTTGQGTSTKFTLSETPKHGDALYQNFGGMQKTGEVDKVFTNGHGVIYRLIDEWNNDVGYDFKNIQYIRPLTDGEYDPDGEDTWVYTFTKFVDAVEDGSLQKQCSQNYIQSTLYGEGLELPYNVLFTTYDGEGNMYCVGNSIKRVSSGNTLLYGCSSIELIMCNNCVIGEGLHEMTIHWGNEEGEFEEGDGCLYVQNKKVLTES